jgi:dienelactone hydrolase
MPAVLRLVAIVALASWLGSGGAEAGSLVEFSNVSEQAPKLLGYLARPSGEDPFPAVVVLHGCDGFGGHTVRIADTLRTWGYVALAIDSLGPRGFNHHCGSFILEQAFDAYAALRFLAKQEYVAASRIAVLGQSMGGASTLSAIDRDMAAQYFVERFAAAIAYYPGCDLAAATLTAPTLILMGEADDWTPADRCRNMATHTPPDSAPIELTIYPGVYHAFDVVKLQPGRRYRGHWVDTTPQLLRMPRQRPGPSSQQMSAQIQIRRLPQGQEPIVTRSN